MSRAAGTAYRVQPEDLLSGPAFGLEGLESLGHGGEVSAELVHRLVAVGGLLGQGIGEDLLHRGRRVRPGLGHRLGLLVEDRADDGLVASPLEGVLSGEHLVEHDPQRPDVGPMVEPLSPGLLGRHVGHRAECRPALGQRDAPRELGQPEVHDLGPAVLGDHDVGALDVPVDDAARVGLAQSRGDLGGDVQGFGGLERAPSDPVPQGLALDVLHGDEGALVAFPGLVDDADIGMGERRRGLGLPQEPLFEIGQLRKLRRQELEGHRALELEVLGLVDNPHAHRPRSRRRSRTCRR
jgi:hypothetical protein